MKIYSFIFLMVITASITFSAAESENDNLMDLYQRKGVKAFVARQYDQAVNDLEQARVIDPSNQKTLKLLARCWERKGTVYLIAGESLEARKCFSLAIEYDPANVEATKALACMDASGRATPSPNAVQVEKTVQQTVSAQQPLPPQSQAPIVIAPQIVGNDSQQTKIVAKMLSNFEAQQNILSQQLTASNELMKRTDQQKEEYLNALVRSSEQKNSMMGQFIIVGAIVVVVVIVCALVIFVFIFGKYAKASDLRTIQATEALQAVLANQQIAIANKSEAPLLLGGPSTDTAAVDKNNNAEANKVAQEAQTGVTCEELSAQDPIERARAVELFEVELANGGSTNPAMEAKKSKLKELLNDTNNRVRANAAKAYYLIDSTDSIRVFNEMLANGSSRLKASAIWALGEIGTAETMELIMKNDNETDEIVSYNIRMALDKIRSRKKISLSTDQADWLEKLIEKYSDRI